jgi:hypothetical protein
MMMEKYQEFGGLTATSYNKEYTKCIREKKRREKNTYRTKNNVMNQKYIMEIYLTERMIQIWM